MKIKPAPGLLLSQVLSHLLPARAPALSRPHHIVPGDDRAKTRQGPGVWEGPALPTSGVILAEEKRGQEKRKDARYSTAWPLCTMAPPMHHGPLCLPPSAAALNPAQQGLALTEDGYDEAIHSG